MESLESAHAKVRRAYNLAARAYYDLFRDEMKDKAYDRKLLDDFAGALERGGLVCDAGCGPAGHIGRYLFDQGLAVVGLDLSDACVALARRANPGMRFLRGDMAGLPFIEGAFDGILSYYSIIHAPKRCAGAYFSEFFRVLKPGGRLLVAVKAGAEESRLTEFLGIRAEIHFAYFTEEDIRGLFERAGFVLELLEKRNPYGFEIQNERVFAIGRKGR